MNTSVSPVPQADDFGGLIEDFMEERRRVVTPAVARAVIWYFGDTNLGVEPGGFVATLIKAITRADSENLEKLRLGFPDYVAAVVAIQREHWGLDWVRSLAREVF